MSFALLLGGCQTPTQISLKEANQQQFLQQQHELNQLPIFSLTKLQAPEQATIHVYIEGDGMAWINKFTPSQNPTPTNPIALKLALQDEHPNIVYLARPCQYHKNRTCKPKLWTVDRFSQITIEAMNDTLTKLVGSGRKLSIIGYSGGGVVSGLMAQNRTDISKWVTIAAPLDVSSWTQYHRISPINHADLLINNLEKLAQISQIHIQGANDKIVPHQINQLFYQRLHTLNAPASTLLVPKTAHEDWPNQRLNITRLL